MYPDDAEVLSIERIRCQRRKADTNTDGMYHIDVLHSALHYCSNPVYESAAIFFLNKPNSIWFVVIVISLKIGHPPIGRIN